MPRSSPSSARPPEGFSSLPEVIVRALSEAEAMKRERTPIRYLRAIFLDTDEALDIDLRASHGPSTKERIMRTMIRRPFIVAAYLALSVAAGTTACGGTDEAQPPSQRPAAAENTTTTATTSTQAESSGGDAAAGAEVWTVAGCGGCHTLAAAGSNGHLRGPNLDELQPDFATVLRQVTNGGGGMPVFSERLSEKQIRDVAAYVSENAGG
jgi:mono/diheme cytochrome c family protein